MKFSDVKNIFERAKRLRTRLEVKDGDGTSWSCTFENGETHSYELNGIKPFEEFQDDIESAFVWLWSLKEYVKKYSTEKGYFPKWVESKINDNLNLCICLDIANSVKHSGLDSKKPNRTKLYPVLGKLNYTIPHTSMEKITVYAFKVVTDISDPTLVSFKMDVCDSNGKRIGDAFEYLDHGIKAWEVIINQIEKNV